MKNLTRCLVALAVTVNTAAVQATEQTQEHHSGLVKVLKGRAVTGTNRLYGEPTTDYGHPMGTVGFYNLAAYNPDGPGHTPIDRNTPDNAIIATGVDMGFVKMAGLPLSLVDESLNNIPLASVGVNISADGEVREAVASTLDVDPLTPNQVPMENVTLKQWLKAKGKARIKCAPNGNYISIRAYNLIPDRLYTVWGLFESPDARFVARPLGGAPNVISTDNKGRGSFRRELGFCPFERTEEGSKLLNIDVVYHSDHQVYGQVPDLALKSLITGTISHTQLEFTVAGESLLDD